MLLLQNFLRDNGRLEYFPTYHLVSVLQDFEMTIPKLTLVEALRGTPMNGALMTLKHPKGHALYQQHLLKPNIRARVETNLWNPKQLSHVAARTRRITPIPYLPLNLRGVSHGHATNV